MAIPKLADLLAAAQNYDAEGDSIEALFCYDGILKDPMIIFEPKILRQAASGLSNLLHRKAGRAIEPARTRLMLDRAIKAIEFARGHTRPAPSDAIILAGLYTTYHEIFADPRHRLAASLLLEDQAAPATD